jgi:DNA sulfur modification protein DndB
MMMQPLSEEPLREMMIAVRSIPTEIRKRMSPHQFVTVQPKQIPYMEAAGWVVDIRHVKSVRMRKPKPHDVAFGDKVWAAFAKLQFTSMNKDRTFELSYGKNPGEVHHIDVFAADEEVVLIIVCKSSETVRTSQFKREVETIQGRRPGLIRELKKEFPSHKIKFILATNNVGMTDQTAMRIKDADIIHMDEEVIDYYNSLADHLGPAARYQLLGNLFAGMKIPNLDPEVVAIEAYIGGHKYYSFSIEPERLLKLAYVLHRTKANKNMMPTYQRLIKKARLKGVTQFVENGGYFPNSLIMSLDTGIRGPRFDPFPRHVGKTRGGILHLPQTFRAAYVIDGQHRLYGYAESGRAGSDLIPVVAFVNLQQSDQVKLFMQINENQQTVPKNLRNTLNADLLWHSPDLREQVKALKLHIAQELGESKTSPLYGRVIIGESGKSSTCCLTIDAISRGVGNGNFLGQFAKSEVKAQGTFYRGSNDATEGPLLEFLTRGLDYFREGLETQFRLGSAEGGFVFINTGVESLIRILSDVVDHLAMMNGYNPRHMSPSQLFDGAITYLDPAITMLGSLDAAQGLEFRQMYGSGASTKYWRRLQQAIHAARSDFDPPKLAEWLEDEAKQYNQEAQDMITDLERFLKKDVRSRLEDEYGAEWFQEGVPRKLRIETGRLAAERNADRHIGHQLESWDCLYIIDYQAIMTPTQDVWKRLFEKRYTRPGDENRSGGWKARSGWLQELNDVRNDVFHSRPVPEERHSFLVSLTAWLINGQDDNDL